MKISIITLGCKVNQYESGGLHFELEKMGHSVSDNIERADVYIINSCAVTAEAERKSRNTVNKCLSHNENAKVYVIGCASQKDNKQFLDKDNVVYVNGNGNKKKVLELIEKRDAVDEIVEYEDFHNAVNSRTRGFIKVQDGCNNFCSYCIIPYLRGRSRSREIQSVVEEIKGLKDINEIVLTGINLSDYKFGGLAELSKKVDELGIRFRFGSLEVNVITDQFLEVMSTLKNFCPQFHLSLQSGSTGVLKKMNRHYTREEYILACKKIQKVFPKSSITTDVIVGFPTETEEDFVDSCDLAREVGFLDMHIFPYSKRTGTVASKMKDLPKEVKKQRVQKLMAVARELKAKYINSYKGKSLTMLTEEYVEGYTVGHTENFIKLYVKGEIPLNSLTCCSLVDIYEDGAIATVNE